MIVQHNINIMDEIPRSTFIESIMRFVNTRDSKGSILSNARKTSEENKKEIDKQLETFVADIKEGKMSYAEMRSRYG